MRPALLAASVLLLGIVSWLRGHPSFVAWEVARDHQRCFSRSPLRARLWSDDPAEVRRWLEARGTPVQPLPVRAGDVEPIGVRYCPLADRVAAHVYYGTRGSSVSVFVLGGPARVDHVWVGRADGLEVTLFRSAGRTLAVVGQDASAVSSLVRALRYPAT